MIWMTLVIGFIIAGALIIGFIIEGLMIFLSSNNEVEKKYEKLEEMEILERRKGFHYILKHGKKKRK